jgi:hypothetical protein
MNKRLLFTLSSILPLLFVACFGGDTAIPTMDSGTVSDASDAYVYPDVSNPFPDGYPSFVDGDDNSMPDVAPCTPAVMPDNGIPYGGGPVILNTVNVYLIWYGDWSYAPNAPALVDNLITGLSSSPYFNINTTYYQLDGRGADGGPVGYQFNNCGSIIYGGITPSDAAAYPFWYPSYVSGQVNLAQSVNDSSYSFGHFLQDADIWSIVSFHLNIKSLPIDDNGVYFVLTSKDVTEGGQCASYCGWHNGMPFGNDYIKYAFIGDPAACLGTCDMWDILEDAGADATPSTPNGDFAADSMASIIAHELEESTTDPGLNAWMGFGENADKCAWRFGQTFDSNGAPANQSLGGRDYLIQMNWENAEGGFCTQHL